uniref:Uncharacterized protein n=1 Tax=Romanomermis culicivorax TaxID=13658 RepID=A0A915HSX5_ROMCU
MKASRRIADVEHKDRKYTAKRLHGVVIPLPLNQKKNRMKKYKGYRAEKLTKLQSLNLGLHLNIGKS